MSIYFHGSFGLNRKNMSHVLLSLVKNPKADFNAIAKPLGYKAPFTQKNKSWLSKTGIIESKNKFELTKFGKIIVDHDPQLETIVTHWFLHHQLTKLSTNAEAWYFFINNFSKKQQSFTRAELENALSQELMSHSAKHFGFGSPMIKVISRKILECYVKEEALGRLGILSSENSSYEINSKKEMGPWQNHKDFETDLVKSL